MTLDGLEPPAGVFWHLALMGACLAPALPSPWLTARLLLLVWLVGEGVKGSQVARRGLDGGRTVESAEISCVRANARANQ